MTTETEIWSGSPSQVINMGTFIVSGVLTLCVLPIAIFSPETGLVYLLLTTPYAIWKYLVVKNTRYELTSQRLKTHAGVFSKTIDEMELYRVKDSRFEQSFFCRLFNVGSVILVSSDSSSPLAKIDSIAGGQQLRETIRGLVEDRRDQKRVRITELE